MKSLWYLIIIVGLLGSAAVVSAETDQSTGDMGWYVIHCNVYDASVYLDDRFVGTIPQGSLTVPALTTGSYKTLTVSKNGYTTYSQAITVLPGKGMSIDLYATLNPASGPTTTTLAPIGGDIGWYVIHSNVEGANVSFDNTPRGIISQGILRVQVYVTGTPYSTYTISKAGYIPFTGSIVNYPAKGETIDLNGTLTASAPAATATQKSPLPLEVTGIAVLFGLLEILRFGRVK